MGAVRIEKDIERIKTTCRIFIILLILIDAARTFRIAFRFLRKGQKLDASKDVKN